MSANALLARELAERLPKPDGTRGRHPVTVDRMVARGELPPFDFRFADGTRGWTGKSLNHPNIAPFVSAAPSAA